MNDYPWKHQLEHHVREATGGLVGDAAFFFTTCTFGRKAGEGGHPKLLKMDAFWLDAARTFRRAAVCSAALESQRHPGERLAAINRTNRTKAWRWGELLAQPLCCTTRR